MRSVVVACVLLLSASEAVKCRDGKSVCPAGSSCCPLATGGFGCCPIPNAVCCADKLHCCPAGMECDTAEGRCVLGPFWRPLYTKQPARVADNSHGTNTCPSGFSCPEKLTCCEKDDQPPGCCPWENGVCCEDGQHCCKFGTTCDLKRMECRSSDSSTFWYHLYGKKDRPKRYTGSSFATGGIYAGWGLRQRQRQLQQQRKPTGYPTFCMSHKIVCPHASTCCYSKTAGPFCCEGEDAVCCENGRCCPSNNTCLLDSDQCSMPFHGNRNMTFTYGTSDPVYHVPLRMRPPFYPEER